MSTVVSPRLPILTADTRWRLHTAARREPQSPKEGATGSTKGGTRAAAGILVGLSLGSPWGLPWSRCPHSPGSSSGAPFNPPQLGRRHLGNRKGIQGGEQCTVGSAKKATRALGWWAGGLSLAERGWSLEKPATNTAT